MSDTNGWRMTRRGFGRLAAVAAASAMIGISRKSNAAYVAQSYSYGMTSAALPRWVAARNRAQSGQGIARVLTLGSSITYGAGSSNLVNETSGSDLAHYSWPSQLAGLLAYLGIPANANGIAFGPSGGNQGRLAGNGHTDPRVVADPAWTPYASAPTLGGCLARSITPGALLSFTPDTPCDTWRVTTVQNIGHGTILGSIDGGGVSSFPTGIAPAGMSHMIFNGAGKTLHLQNAGTAPVYVSTIEAWSSQSPSVVITNAGWPGARLGDFASNYTAKSACDPLTAALAFAPDLYIVEAGINDWYKGTPLSTYTSQLNALLTALHGVADVVLVSSSPSNPAASGSSSIANQQAFVSATQSVASSHGIPFVDNWSAFGAWVNNQAMFSADPVLHDLHPNMIGYMRFAENIARALASV